MNMDKPDIDKIMQAIKNEDREYILQNLIQPIEDAYAFSKEITDVKSRFLARISHEMRTPLANIFSYALLMENNKGDDDIINQSIAQIKFASKIALAVVNDLVLTSKYVTDKEGANVIGFDFVRFLAHIRLWAMDIAKAKGVNFVMMVESDFDNEYMGDEEKIIKLLKQLITNAVKYTPKGGEVKLVVRQADVHKDREKIRFIVSDNGIGIRKEFYPQLFEPFSQDTEHQGEANGGLGLGLALCKQIADMTDGSISFYSKLGEGSEFVYEATLLTSINIKSINWSSKSVFDSITAIVADENEDTAIATTEMLAKMGISAKKVCNHKLLMDTITESHSLLILDKSMLVTAEGVNVINLLKQSGYASLKIIVTCIEPDEQEILLNSGVDYCLFRPVLPELLNKAIQRVTTNQDIIIGKLMDNFDFTDKRILLVEDNEMNVDIARRILENKKMIVDVATNGLKAVQAFENNLPNYYDAILMDVQMPVMDGLTATKTIRASNKLDSKTIPIIAMTANFFDEDVATSKACGMNAHITKPVEPKALYRLLASYLIRK